MVLAAMGVVGWIRLRPLALPGLGWQAEALVRARVAGAGTRDDAAVDAWVAAHPAVFARKVATTRTRLAAQLRYRADDGREHVYLGDLDSYLWLRRARQYLARARRATPSATATAATSTPRRGVRMRG